MGAREKSQKFLSRDFYHFFYIKVVSVIFYGFYLPQFKLQYFYTSSSIISIKNHLNFNPNYTHGKYVILRMYVCQFLNTNSHLKRMSGEYWMSTDMVSLGKANLSISIGKAGLWRVDYAKPPELLVTFGGKLSYLIYVE